VQQRQPVQREVHLLLPDAADQPKLQITRHGAIWSDMRNIKALAALYRS
jgi:hypothetical protein